MSPLFCDYGAGRRSQAVPGISTLRVFRIARIFRLFAKFKGLTNLFLAIVQVRTGKTKNTRHKRNLLEITYRTKFAHCMDPELCWVCVFGAVQALPTIMNVGAVLFLLFFIYAVFFMLLFGRVKRGDFLTERANFESFGVSLLTVRIPYKIISAHCMEK